MRCARLQVLDAKPYVGGYLVRIRGEARLGIQGLSQMEPYLRAQVGTPRGGCTQRDTRHAFLRMER